jgi:hypothetical protein
VVAAAGGVRQGEERAAGRAGGGCGACCGGVRACDSPRGRPRGASRAVGACRTRAASGDHRSGTAAGSCGDPGAACPAAGNNAAASANTSRSDSAAASRSSIQARRRIATATRRSGDAGDSATGPKAGADPGSAARPARDGSTDAAGTGPDAGTPGTCSTSSRREAAGCRRFSVVDSRAGRDSVDSGRAAGRARSYSGFAAASGNDSSR